MNEPARRLIRIETTPGGWRAAAGVTTRPEAMAWREARPDGLSAVLRELAAECGSVIEHIQVDVPFDPEQLELLAGVCAGAVLVGFMPAAAGQVVMAARLEIAGEMDINGDERLALDEAAMRARLPSLASERGLRALAVGGVNSTMNPEHERRAAELARGLTGLPVLEGRYFREASSAVERVQSAGRAAAWLLGAAERAAQTRTAAQQASLDLPIRLSGAPPSALQAIAAARCAPLLAQSAAVLVEPAAVAQARITRVSRERYACHCEDGRFEFDSLTVAKAFVEQHLREQLTRAAAGAGAGDGRVVVEVNDRYGQGRGKKGAMHVYLDSTVVARVRQD